MVTIRQKQGAGVAATALLLLGSVYAWQSSNQHKTNELSGIFGVNDVTLVEDFVPITNWFQGQEVNKDISVKNNTTAETGNNAYVRIQLKEFLEFTDRTETLSTVRYAVTTEGNFAKFDTLEAAQAYAAANNLTGTPVKITTTAFEGANKWFIPTNAEATHGQYGKFLVLKVGGGNSKSIIDESVSKATNIDHQAIKHAEDAYTTQLFNSGNASLRTYPKLVKDTPTGGGIDSAKDLKDYISWTFGDNITTTDTFTAAGATAAQWVIDPTTGWVYWSKALAPGQTTGKFLDKLKLTLAPKNVSLYYAIHTDLEAVDYDEIDTMAPPTEIKKSWQGSTTPETPETPAITVPNTDPGNEFEFANTMWRILKTDMDDDASNGNQALVIRVDVLTNEEAGKGGTPTDRALVNFRDGSTYFSENGSNGYQAGADNSNYVKGAIDHYYTNYIANNPDYIKYVQAVDLHNPSYDEFKSGQSFSGSAYNAWVRPSNPGPAHWQDTRFKTTLGGAKQAFALSNGDIHTIDGVGADDNRAAKLNFDTYNSFWLRSPGNTYGNAGFVNDSAFSWYNQMNNNSPVRPALSIQIK